MTNSVEHEPEDISIVMAVYNHERTLAAALDSALRQEMPYRSKIYCFNDASTDNSAAILQEYAERFPGRIQIFTSPVNQGSGKKSYLFHRPHIQGRYWCFLEGDDYWLSTNKLAKQLEFLEKHSDYVGCSCTAVLFNEITLQDKLIKPSVSNWNLLDLIYNPNKHRLYVHTASIVWRNIYLAERNFFLPREFEKPYATGDVMLAHMMLARGGLMHNIDQAMSCYRYTGDGVWSALSYEQQVALNKRVAAGVERSLPVRYRLLRSLQPIRNSWPLLQKVIPGAINA